MIIEQVVNAVGKGAYWSIKKILEYIVPIYIQKGKLDPIIPTIYLWISGDSRNVGWKVKHVMITTSYNAMNHRSFMGVSFTRNQKWRDYLMI